ncbi:MAG: M50 family metallopeptidase [Eubacteriales bacterium]
MPGMVWQILLAVFVFGLLVLTHELGHFIAARCFGVKVYEFAIGMGTKLLSYTSKKSGVIYSLRFLPFGGFVSMLGETEEGEEHNPESLSAKPAGQRLVVHAAGAAMNLLFGFLVMAILSSVVTLGTTKIHHFFDTELTGYEYSSRDSGLREDDVIVRVGKRRVYIADQVLYEVMRNGQEPVEIVVRRGEEYLSLTVSFPIREERGQRLGDTDFQVYAEKSTVGTVIKHTVHKSVLVVNMVWESLFDLIRGRYTLEAASGPIGMAGELTSAAKSGAGPLLYLVAIISINLGVMNLLPLPALDGGHLLYVLFEIVFRKPLPMKYANLFDFVGFALLMGLLVLVTFKDIAALF